MKFLLSTILICALLFNIPSLMAAETGSGTGTVAETIDAGGYTYLRLKEVGHLDRGCHHGRV